MGKKFGLGGNNDLEDLEIDAIVDSVNDFRISNNNKTRNRVLIKKCTWIDKMWFKFSELSVAYWESDPDVKEKKMKEVHETIVPFYSEKFEEIAKSNNGHMALGRVRFSL